MPYSFHDEGLVRVWRFSHGGSWNCLFMRDNVTYSIVMPWWKSAAAIADRFLNSQEERAELTVEISDYMLSVLRDEQGVLVGLSHKGSDPIAVQIAMRQLERRQHLLQNLTAPSTPVPTVRSEPIPPLLTCPQSEETKDK